MRGWWGKVQPENIRSSPVPLWPICGPPKKYIRDCPLSLNLSAGEKYGSPHHALTTHPALRATSPYTGEARGVEDAAPYKAARKTGDFDGAVIRWEVPNSPGPPNSLSALSTG